MVERTFDLEQWRGERAGLFRQAVRMRAAEEPRERRGSGPQSRHDEEQWQLLRRMIRMRWQRAEADGRVRWTGPRSLVYRVASQH